MRVLVLLFLGLLQSVVIVAQGHNAKRQFAITHNSGTVLQTSDFLSGSNAIPYYQSYAVKVGMTSSEGSVWDKYYGSPYWGIGVYTIMLGRYNDFGEPYSVFLYQGARITKITTNCYCSYHTWRRPTPIPRQT